MKHNNRILKAAAIKTWRRVGIASVSCSLESYRLLCADKGTGHRFSPRLLSQLSEPHKVPHSLIFRILPQSLTLQMYLRACYSGSSLWRRKCVLGNSLQLPPNLLESSFSIMLILDNYLGDFRNMFSIKTKEGNVKRKHMRLLNPVPFHRGANQGTRWISGHII